MRRMNRAGLVLLMIVTHAAQAQTPTNPYVAGKFSGSHQVASSPALAANPYGAGGNYLAASPANPYLNAPLADSPSYSTGHSQLGPPGFVPGNELPPPTRLPSLESIESETVLDDADFPESALLEAVATPVADEVLALEIEPEPSWFSRAYWFPPTLWDGSVELGINGSTGNSEIFSMKSGAKAKRKSQHSVMEFDAAYVKTNTNSAVTQHNAISNGKLEYLFQQSPFTAFTKSYFEYDEFKAYDMRIALNAGLGYRWLDTEPTKLTTRLGVGWSREIGGPDDRFVPEGVAGIEFERQISKRQQFSFVSDYFPDWEDFSSFRTVTTTSWQLRLDDEQRLSLKVGAVNRYDSTPNGTRPNDLNYSVVLLWQL